MLRTAAFCAAALASFAVVPAAAQPPIPLPTRDFVQAAASSDLFEITEARVALMMSQDPQVRAFAERMIADHTRIRDALLQAIARSGRPPVPDALASDKEAYLAALQSVKGKEFNTLYARQQMLAHTEAVVVEGNYAAGGEDPNIRQAVAAALPVIQEHLQMAKELQAGLPGS